MMENIPPSVLKQPPMVVVTPTLPIDKIVGLIQDIYGTMAYKGTISSIYKTICWVGK